MQGTTLRASDDTRGHVSFPVDTIYRRRVGSYIESFLIGYHAEWLGHRLTDVGHLQALICSSFSRQQISLYQCIVITQDNEAERKSFVMDRCSAGQNIVSVLFPALPPDCYVGPALYFWVP